MKPLVTYSIVIFVFLLVSSSDLTAKKKFPVLKGPYLGQEPPGMTPEISAPGIFSTEKRELNLVFSSKGDEFFFRNLYF